MTARDIRDLSQTRLRAYTESTGCPNKSCKIYINFQFQVSQVQKDFQDCSHNQSLSLYETLQSLEEGRFSRETNELNGELAREDSEPASLDPLKDIKPRLCNSLEAIAKECIGESTVFKNHRKSRIQHCERGELRLH